MAITNAKNNFFARLLGKDNFGRKISTENNQAAAGMRTSPQFQNQPIPELQPQGGNPFMQGQQPQQGAMPAAPQAGQSRYAMYEMMQPKPTRDTEQEGIIQRRAKMNAFSKGFSGLAGLAGVAVGGDAPFVPDGVTPFNMNQLQTMDNDYRNRLQDWTNKGFQVDQSNTGLQNREIDQTIDQENRTAIADQRFQNDQILLEQRANNALQQLQAKSQEDQIREMESLGVNPYGENAYGDYLKAKGVEFSTEINRKKAQTNWNNRLAGGSRLAAGKQEFDLPTLQRGKKAMIDQLESQKKGLDPFRDKGQLEAIEAQLKQIREYNPGKNELMDAEVMNMGIQADEGGIENEQGQEAGGPLMPGFKNLVNETLAGKSKAAVAEDPQRTARITSGLQKIADNSASDEEFEAVLQDLVDAGEAADLDEAYNLLIEFLKPNQ